MNTFERAVENQEFVTEQTIQEIRSKAGKTLLFSGYCYYCDEPVHSPHLYCNTDCRDDWEREQRLLAISGKS